MKLSIGSLSSTTSDSSQDSPVPQQLWQNSQSPLESDSKPPAQSVTASSSSSSSSLIVDNDDDIELVDPKDVVLNSWIQTATLNDVVYTDEPQWSVFKKRNQAKGDQKTRLQSIAKVDITVIQRGELRQFVTRFTKERCRRTNKKELCEFTVGVVEKWKKNGGVLDKKEVVKKSSVSRKRFLNVLFSEEILPLLSLRGDRLSKDEMTEGRKTDQDLYEAIAKAYNNTGAYNDDAFPSIGFSSSKYDGPITWLQSKATFSVLSKEYEMAFNRSKNSRAIT